MATESRTTTGETGTGAVGVVLFFLPLFAVLPLYQALRGDDQRQSRRADTLEAVVAGTFGTADDLSVLALESAVLFVVPVAVVGFLAPGMGLPGAVRAILGVWVGVLAVLLAIDVLSLEFFARTLAAVLAGIFFAGLFVLAATVPGGYAGFVASVSSEVTTLVAVCYGAMVANGYVATAQSEMFEDDSRGDDTVDVASAPSATELPESEARSLLEEFVLETPAAPNDLASRSTIRSAQELVVYRDLTVELRVSERTTERSVTRSEFDDIRSGYRTNPEERHDVSPSYSGDSYKYLIEESVERRHCPSCDGGGRSTCPTCGGTGTDDGPCGACGGTGRSACGTCDGTGQFVDFVVLERTYEPVTGVDYRNREVPDDETVEGVITEIDTDASYHDSEIPEEVLSGVEGETVEERTQRVDAEGIHGRRFEVHEIPVTVVSYEYGADTWTLYEVDDSIVALRYPTKYRRQFGIAKWSAVVLIPVFLVLAAVVP